jgi:exopolysaccharide production protein ExoQ
MPPLLLLLLTFLFIGFLVLRDHQREPGVPPWLWIPLVWVLIVGSRPVAFWLDVGLAAQDIVDIESGNPIDRVVYLALIAGGVFAIMGRRQVARSWYILKKNPWVVLFFCYCALSISWSDYSFVALKRWIKEIGNLLMVLIIMTAPGHPEPLKWVLRRCAYVLVPLSVTLIKYFPEYSKYYDPWTGYAYYIGVTTSKNMLGILCLILGLFFTWEIITKWRTKKDPVDFILLGMIVWLLYRSESMTSMLVLAFGIGLLILFHVLGERALEVEGYVILMPVFFAILDAFFEFEISGTLIEMLGRDRTLTGRTEIWEAVIRLVPNALIGSGYESFWLGERLAKLWATFWYHPNQSHNGYLEIYLNLGWIGIILFAGMVVTAYLHSRQVMAVQFEYGSFRIVFWLTALMLNMTEAVFKGGSVIWILFLIVAMDRVGMDWKGGKEPDD